MPTITTTSPKEHNHVGYPSVRQVNLCGGLRALIVLSLVLQMVLSALLGEVVATAAASGLVASLRADGSQDYIATTIYDDFYHLFPIRQVEPLGLVNTAQYYGVNGLPVSDPKAY